MALRVSAMGPVLEDGGTMFIATGAAPGGTLEWTLAGAGTLTPTEDTANELGVGTARYDAAGAASGQAIVVGVVSYG